METLPPVDLGIIILVSFAIVIMVRHPLESRFVLTVAEPMQPKRRFVFEIALCLIAGAIAVTYNRWMYQFPITSGISLLFGCLAIGFFAGIDMALAHERNIIYTALAQSRYAPPPKRLISVTRKFSLVALVTAMFVTLVLAMVISRDIVWLSKIDQNPEALARAQMSVSYEIFFIMAVLLAMTGILIISYSKNLKLLFNNETNVLENVARGDLSKQVPVATNDEFGVIAGHTNSMIDGLRHRIQLITSLKLAEEVQQNLLPHQQPEVPGLDIAGISIYCDQTGGDYYDYLTLPNGRLAVVVADASEHGVGAAMLMTTARAFLLYGAQKHSEPHELVTEINRFLTKDSHSLGRFVTMFYIEIDPEQKTLRWVRAGHEPAILYDPLKASFQELYGEGMALGIDAEYQSTTSTHHGWSPGTVLFIGTDGIHETQNQNDAMYGRKRLRQILENNHSASAKEIQQKVIDSVQTFRGDLQQEDDITLVVIKLT